MLGWSSGFVSICGLKGSSAMNISLGLWHQLSWQFYSLHHKQQQDDCSGSSCMGGLGGFRGIGGICFFNDRVLSTD